jgi:pectinesterase
LNSIYGNKIVKSEGWSVWDTGTNTSLITYAEYKSKGFNGALADVSKRVSWSKQLTDAQALVYYDNSKIFGTWDPCTVANVCPTAKGELVMLNFKVTKGANLSTPTTFAWNTAWNMKDIQFSVYRSVDTKTNFVKLKDITSTTDTLWNYTTNDNAPEAGKTYYYVIKATKTGFKEFNTDTVSVTSLPTITLNGTLSDFLQGLGAPSASQVYTVTGENLPSALVITLPNNFEASIDGGKTWNTSSVSISPVSGIVPTTSVLIRLNAKAAGNYAGTISHTSTGAGTKTLTLTGVTQTEALAFSQRLAFWSMNISDADSAAVRAKGVTVSKPSLKRLYLSNGSVIPAYSTLHGQAFAPSANGGGLWTTAGGGGNNLYRGSYEQIVIKCNTDYTLRVDSLQLKTALYAAATGKFALVYSKTGFKSDSSEASASLSAGIPLAAGANGKFATPIVPNAEPSSTTTRYQFALNGSTGINMVAGDSLTFRLYYSTGSSSTGRYAKIKDLELLGVSKAILKPALALTQAFQDFNYMIGMTNEPQSYTVTAENIQGEIQLVPSAFFELSLDKTTWVNAASVLKITPTNGMVSTKVYVRFTASTAGSYTGTITHKATGVQDITVNLKGVVTKPLGIDEIGNHALLLSPNPSINEVQVSHPAEKAELRLIDLQGNSKISQSLTGHTTTTTLSLQGLPSGVYLVEWSTGEKSY